MDADTIRDWGEGKINLYCPKCGQMESYQGWLKNAKVHTAPTKRAIASAPARLSCGKRSDGAFELRKAE